MKRVYPGHLCVPAALVFAGMTVCALLGGHCPAAEKLPDATDLARRMVERAQAVARGERGPQYTYEKRSLLEELSANGQTNKSTEKIYQVTLVGGFPFNRLVRIQGRELTNDELKKEQQREDRFQQKVTSGEARKKALGKEGWVTTELLDRYQFTVQERVLLQNRPTLVVSFKPKDGKLPSKTFQDKILNRVSGTVWVDEADADAAKLTVNLGESVSLGILGVLGSLERFEMSLERQRLPDGVWVNTRQNLLLYCRKLLSTSRYRNTEESSGFKKVEAKG
jgi:hypothetical protein